MDDSYLLTVETPSGESASVEELRGLVRQLTAQVAVLTARLDQVQAENRQLKAEIVRKDARIAELEGEVQQLKRRLFAPKSERAARSKSNRSNALVELELSPSVTVRKRGRQPGQSAPQRRQHEHLPVVEEFIQPSPEQCVCSKCGAPRTPHGTEDCEQIEIEVRAYRKVIRRGRQRRTCSCEDEALIVTAAPPNKVVAKGCLGNSVFVDVLLAKYQTHLPLQRWLLMWRERGLDISAATVCDGLHKIATLLQPIHTALLERTAGGSFAQADETRWLMFVDHEGKNSHTWWLWAFLSSDAIAFRLSPTRAHDVPEEHFSHEHELTLLVDRYAAYKAMTQTKLGLIKLAFCWSHVRRDFIEAYVSDKQCRLWASLWLKRIRTLYQLCRERDEQLQRSDHQAAVTTTTRLRECLSEMHSAAAESLRSRGLMSVCRPALESLLNHWEGLTRFVADSQIPLDNNRSERAQRGPAVSRKNYYGAASPWGGDLAARMFSIIATLDLHGLNSRAWLSWYLGDCRANSPPADIASYLPWNLTASRRADLKQSRRDTS